MLQGALGAIVSATLDPPLGRAAGRPHPLDPLSAVEVVTCAAACREHASSLGLPPLRFNSIAAKVGEAGQDRCARAGLPKSSWGAPAHSRAPRAALQEPNKHAVLAHLADPATAPPPQRLALCILQAPPRNSVVEALLDLDAAQPSVLSWKEVRSRSKQGGREGEQHESRGERGNLGRGSIPQQELRLELSALRCRLQMEGVQPAVTMDDCFLAEELLKKNVEFAAFVEGRYGITDLALLACDPWYSGVRCARLRPLLQRFQWARGGK